MAANAGVGADTPSTGRAGSARVAVQKFGTFLSGMIMPNIAAFIAWGGSAGSGPMMLGHRTLAWSGR
jgi:hypothetical protein